jgi:diguanylate cyclase (GGDEF)-like protein
MAQGMLRVYQNFLRLLNDSEKDTLTGLMNRRRLEKHLGALLASRHKGRRGDDQRRRDFLAVLDIDHFKRVNDTFGHLFGDEVLLAFANLIRRSLREGDNCYRYGGEEFIILLRELAREQVMSVLERLRGHVANHVFPQAMHITVSIGFTRVGGQQFPAEIVEEADRALYYAKNHGRDQVREFQALSLAGEIEMPEASGSVEMF